uniref:Uncharacterized protein n=1 Tax=Erythrolobus australicus TaxID=1077150 RepID=A0A7S1TKG9_9RHOD
MVSYIKVAVENTRVVFAMLMVTLGLSQMIGRDFPRGFAALFDAVVGSGGAAARAVHAAASTAMVLCGAAMYTREELLAIAILWLLFLVLTTAASLSASFVAPRAAIYETRLFCATMFLALSAQFFCVFTLAVRRKAKELRRQRTATLATAAAAAPPRR